MAGAGRNLRSGHAREEEGRGQPYRAGCVSYQKPKILVCSVPNVTGTRDVADCSVADKSAVSMSDAVPCPVPVVRTVTSLSELAGALLTDQVSEGSPPKK